MAVTIDIECRLPSGEIGKVPISAIPIAEGLAVHKDYEPYRSQQLGKTWAVTHRPSGYRILGYFKTRRAALNFAEQIALLTDWTEDKKTVLEASTEFMPRLREIREAFKADRL